MKPLKIKNARIHNLKNINVEIPKYKFIVATGISGSGKSSLIFDTIFEEGKKMYLDSIGMSSIYRDEEIVDHIGGLAPTVAVMQKIIRQKNPRSVVGTKTGLLNLLSILFSLEGEFPCGKCGTRVKGALVCPECGESGSGLKSGYFQFSSPKGMCYNCNGKGYVGKFNSKDFITDENEKAIDIWLRAHYYPKSLPENVKKMRKRVESIFKSKYGCSLFEKYKDLPKPIQNIFINYFPTRSEKGGTFCGLKKVFEIKSRSLKISKNDKFYQNVECPDCSGTRLGEFGRKTLLSNKSISELAYYDLKSLQKFLTNIEKKISTAVGKKVLCDIQLQLKNMINIGLGYLHLYRKMPTLSGGEVQRLLLNHHIENELEGLIYIFDEPTAGLHESEKNQLLDKIQSLKENGNTVLVVEHDENTIRRADYILDFGPKAGFYGGEIVFQGDSEEIENSEASITGSFLKGKKRVYYRNLSDFQKIDRETEYLSFKNVSVNNLKNIDVEIPLRRIVGICGVSGSGKSSLVNSTIVPSLKKRFKNRIKEEKNSLVLQENEHLLQFSGAESIEAICVVDQAPIGRNSTSIVATYLGVWNHIRKFFSSNKEVKAAGFTKSHFSFNSKKGGCPQCKGRGEEVYYLSGYVKIKNTCRLCHGKRYNKEVLNQRVNGKNIQEVLNLTVTEALEFFKDNKTIIRKLKIFDETGMGYISLGQSTRTISGGEAQRLKLAKQLVKRKKGHVLYIFDEPTTGLSFYDIDKFLKLIYKIYQKKNSILIIEHDPDVLSFCDYLIELGPKGGTEGGYLHAKGSPLEMKENENSITGKYLKIHGAKNE